MGSCREGKWETEWAASGEQKSLQSQDCHVGIIPPARMNPSLARSLLQGIFPTQGSNLDLPHCRQILYQLSHQGSRRILEWVAYPFSSRSSQPRKWTGVSCIAGRILYQLSYQGSPWPGHLLAINYFGEQCWWCACFVTSELLASQDTVTQFWSAICRSATSMETQLKKKDVILLMFARQS